MKYSVFLKMEAGLSSATFILFNQIPDEYKNDPVAIAECWAGSVTRMNIWNIFRMQDSLRSNIIEESEPYEKGKVMVASWTLAGTKPKLQFIANKSLYKNILLRNKMKKNIKRLFSLTILLKLFLITSITAGNPVSTIKEGDNKVTIVYLTNDTFKQMVYNYEKNKEWKYEGTKPAIIDFYASMVSSLSSVITIG